MKEEGDSMELCAVARQMLPMPPESVRWMFDSQKVPTPLHLAVLIRLSGNVGASAKLTSELAAEFEEIGWCDSPTYVRVTEELIDLGLADGMRLQVDPSLHTGDDCLTCLAHQDAFAADWQRYRDLQHRWEHGRAEYPYAASSATLHLRDCTYANAAPKQPRKTLRQFAHGNRPGQVRLVTDDDAATIEDYYGSVIVVDRLPFGVPGGLDYARGPVEQVECMSIREARAWTVTRTGPHGGLRWKACKVCRPYDPFVLDTADITVRYLLGTSTLLTVEAHDGHTVTQLRRIVADRGVTFGRGAASPAQLAATAAVIMGDAARVTVTESAMLPLADFAAAFLTAAPGPDILRTDVRAWIRDWYRSRSDIPEPAALAGLLDRDMALQPDQSRVLVVR